MSKNLDIAIEVKLYNMKYSSRNKQLESISEVSSSSKNKTFATFTRLNVKSEMFAISDRYDR